MCVAVHLYRSVFVHSIAADLAAWLLVIQNGLQIVIEREEESWINSLVHTCNHGCLFCHKVATPSLRTIFCKTCLFTSDKLLIEEPTERLCDAK